MIYFIIKIGFFIIGPNIYMVSILVTLLNINYILILRNIIIIIIKETNGKIIYNEKLKNIINVK